MAAIQFTSADRDDQGFIKAPAAPPIEPRLLADLLPTTDHRPPTTRVSMTRQELLSATIVVPLLVGALLYLSSGRYAVPPVVRQPTAAPATQLPTPNPHPPSPIPAVMLPAYAAPDGPQLGEIEATRAITPTAHYGTAWIQADVAGSGLIWLNASDWPHVGIVGPDLAPPREQEIGNRQQIPIATEDPPPAPCTVIVYGNNSGFGQMCDTDLALLQAQYPGGHVIANGQAEFEAQAALQATREVEGAQLAQRVTLGMTATAVFWEKRATPTHLKGHP